MQKEEKDSLITDNKKLMISKLLDRFDNDDILGAPGGSPGSRPSIVQERRRIDDRNVGRIVVVYYIIDSADRQRICK